MLHHSKGFFEIVSRGFPTLPIREPDKHEAIDLLCFKRNSLITASSLIQLGRIPERIPSTDL
jgi:hypothetical protein